MTPPDTLSDPDTAGLRALHPSWAFERLDSGAIEARQPYTGNQQITSSYDADELDIRLKGYGPLRTP